MEYYEITRQLKNNLIKSQNVRKIDENASDKIAISLLDIEESNQKINLLINKLLIDNELLEEDVNDILYNIGDEFRHVLYHIKEMPFYDYLMEND